jgi:hypothetical protein
MYQILMKRIKLTIRISFVVTLQFKIYVSILENKNNVDDSQFSFANKS